MQMCTLKNKMCALLGRCVPYSFRMCTLNLMILTLIGEMYALQFKDVYLEFRH